MTASRAAYLANHQLQQQSSSPSSHQDDTAATSGEQVIQKKNFQIFSNNSVGVSPDMFLAVPIDQVHKLVNQRPAEIKQGYTKKNSARKKKADSSDDSSDSDWSSSSSDSSAPS